MKYFCHVWAVMSEILGMCKDLHIWLHDSYVEAWAVGPSLAASLEPFCHPKNVGSCSVFSRYFFGRCSSELAELVLLPYSWGRCTGCSDRLHDFSVILCRCHNVVFVNSFFPCTAGLSNSLHAECFPVAFDVNGFKSRANRHLLSCSSL